MKERTGQLNVGPFSLLQSLVGPVPFFCDGVLMLKDKMVVRMMVAGEVVQSKRKFENAVGHTSQISTCPDPKRKWDKLSDETVHD